MKSLNHTQCYIGDKIFDKALDIYKKTYPGGSSDQFNIQWIPFYLDANAPTVGIPMTERMAQKNGSERVTAIQTRLQRVGRAYGISFSFGGKIGRTRDSHRLIYAAGLQNSQVQRILIDEIFRFFETDRDFTSHSDLLQAAVLAGLSEENTKLVLESDQYGDIVDQLATHARSHGISSVPTVEVNGVRVEGAEDFSVFFDAFVNAKESGSERRVEPGE